MESADDFIIKESNEKMSVAYIDVTEMVVSSLLRSIQDKNMFLLICIAYAHVE